MAVFKVYVPGTSTIHRIEADEFDYNPALGIFIFSGKKAWVATVAPAPGLVIVNLEHEKKVDRAS
jgi:hypothetical protein